MSNWCLIRHSYLYNDIYCPFLPVEKPHRVKGWYSPRSWSNDGLIHWKLSQNSRILYHSCLRNSLYFIYFFCKTSILWYSCNFLGFRSGYMSRMENLEFREHLLMKIETFFQNWGKDERSHGYCVWQIMLYLCVFFHFTV